MANLKQVLAALKQKQADLDMIDDQISAMPEMAPDAPIDGPTSPEFDLLSDKREELEEEIRKMREGVQLISEWEKFKGGQWSEEIKNMLGEIDIEIADIAGGEDQAPVGDMLAGPEAPDMAPAPDMGAPAPDMAPAPEAPVAPEAPADVPPAPDAAAPAPEVDPAAAPAPAPEEPAAVDPVAAPMASAKSSVSKKNSYQAPDKKGISSPSSLKKEGSNMANETTSKPSLKEKLAEVKSKREAIKKEAQQRVAAAWTIAKTMLPSAPAEIQKNAAATLLQNSTPVLNAMLRQTAKNAHYSKLAEEVHKKEMNDLMEEPGVLKSERAAVEKELKGDAKNAAAKVADDRKECGTLPEKYDDGRNNSEPKQMDAGNAAKRPENTINMSEGGDKVAAKKSAACECKEAECKCAAGDDEKGKEWNDEATVKSAKAKKADESAVMEEEAPAPEAPEAPEAPAEGGEEAIEPPADMPEEAPMEDDSAAEVMSDEKKMLVEEKINEAQEAISALEKEILEESAEGEDLDYSQIFNDGSEGELEGGELEGQQELEFPAEEDMEEKVSSLANEGEEKFAGSGEEYFAPSAAADLEEKVDGQMFASMEDFFSLQGSDSDPLASLMASDIHTAADVAGMNVIPSSTGEAAKEFMSDEATGETRDNESDHEGDLFAEAIENVGEPEKSGHKRIPQDSTNKLEEPKSAKKQTPVINKLKPVVASDKKPMDIASALFGNDEF